MSQQPLVTVIVLVYNAERYLQRCIDSICNQTYRNLQVILVDDGSTDLSPDICDKNAESDTRIEVIHRVNGGYSRAFNNALDRMRGEYLVNVDNDDWMDPRTIEILYQLLDKNAADISFCGFQLVNKYEGSDVANDTDYPIHVLDIEEAIKKIIEDKDVGSYTWGRLYRASLFEGFRYPEGIGYVDVSSTYKFFLRSNRVVYTEAPYYFYYQNPEGVSRTRKLQLSIDQYLAYEEQTKDVAERFKEIEVQMLKRNCEFLLSTYCFYLRDYYNEPCYVKQMLELKNKMRELNQNQQVRKQLSTGTKFRIFLVVFFEKIYRMYLRRGIHG